ncbi:hypothetical protein ERJ75_001065800 [Trypanosoma vivax]|nr:hypothetical protein ERJ75_001065800 [Trypanosoma vivax]
MEWNSTFTTLQQRAVKLNRTAAKILDSRSGGESFVSLADSVKTTREKVINVLSNVAAALAANTIFRASVLQDFYMAFECVRGIGGNFTFGHKNVARDSGNITEAEETFSEFLKNFTSCRKDPGVTSKTASEEESLDCFPEEEQEASDGVGVDVDNDCDDGDDGSFDIPLDESIGVSIEALRGLKELSNSRTDLWSKVGKDMHCAIKAMNVSTFVSDKNGFHVTRNMWSRGFINLTNVIDMKSKYASDPSKESSRWLEACCHICHSVCVVYDANKGKEVDQALSIIDSVTFRTNMFGYGCKKCVESSYFSWCPKSEVSCEKDKD